MNLNTAEARAAAEEREQLIMTFARLRNLSRREAGLMHGERETMKLGDVRQVWLYYESWMDWDKKMGQHLSKKGFVVELQPECVTYRHKTLAEADDQFLKVTRHYAIELARAALELK